MTITNYLSIDVEDYFQVSAFEGISPPETWKSREHRVDRNTEKLLGILEGFDVKATFFVLGWVAQHFPDLVRRISGQGHEVASHGFGHRRVTTQSRQEFRNDIRRSKGLLEDLTGRQVFGYRAPSYSIGLETLWAFDELYDAGFHYDSSVFPVRHDFYGIHDWPRFPFKVVRMDGGAWGPVVAMDDHVSTAMLEVPIATLRLGGRNMPIAGGGYFRFFPYAFTRWGLRQINLKENNPFVFYLHPWEVDPEQPRLVGAGLKSRFRHYINLGKTEDRFRSLLQDFSFAPIHTLLQKRDS